jgi:hypothetical protein
LEAWAAPLLLQHQQLTQWQDWKVFLEAWAAPLLHLLQQLTQWQLY